LLEIQNAESDHEAGADDTRARSIHAKTGQSAERQHQINGEEDEDGRQEKSLLYAAHQRADIGPRLRLAAEEALAISFR